MDRGAWLATVHRVTKSRTPLRDTHTHTHTHTGASGKEPACSAGDLGSIPGLGRSAEEGNGNPLQYSCLENLMDREALRVIVHSLIL